MRLRVKCDLEEWPEKVVNDGLEGVNESVTLVDVVQPGNLDEPANVVAVNVPSLGPLGQLVPLGRAAAVNAETQLRILKMNIFF